VLLAVYWVVLGIADFSLRRTLCYGSFCCLILRLSMGKIEESKSVEDQEGQSPDGLPESPRWEVVVSFVLDGDHNAFCPKIRKAFPSISGSVSSDRRGRKGDSVARRFSVSVPEDQVRHVRDWLSSEGATAIVDATEALGISGALGRELMGAVDVDNSWFQDNDKGGDE